MLEMSVQLLLLHLIGCVGLVIVVSLGDVMAPVRARLWPKMLGCPMCFGVWAGTVWSWLLVFRPVLPHWFVVAHDATAFSFCVSLVGFVVGLFDYCAERK